MDYIADAYLYSFSTMEQMKGDSLAVKVQVRVCAEKKLRLMKLSSKIWEKRLRRLNREKEPWNNLPNGPDGENRSGVVLLFESFDSSPRRPHGCLADVQTC
jgi:hypothetical protein